MNVCFEMLDAAVIHGRADDPVLIADDLGTTHLGHARLLEDVAAVGGVLKAVEVAPGDPVSVDVADDTRAVVALLAVARIGAVVAEPGRGTVSFDESAQLCWADQQLDWEAVLKAGRTDPAACVERDPEAAYDDARTVAEQVRRVAAMTLPSSAGQVREVLS